MRIEYEDQDLIVVYKEAGLPVQTGRVAQKDLVSLLKNHVAEQSAAGPRGPAADPYLGIVHRLDQPVEGLLVFAKTRQAAAHLSRQAAGHDMKKEYRALVQLEPEAWPLALEARRKSVTLADWLLRDPSANRSVVVEEGARGAKRAELEFRTLDLRDGLADVRIALHTGRHHQIRVQMAHAGMPLAGDRKYGGQTRQAGRLPDEDRDRASVYAPDPTRLCLCAADLSFLHPNGSGRRDFHVEPTFSLPVATP